jgi:hypothetical protein
LTEADLKPLLDMAEAIVCLEKGDFGVGVTRMSSTCRAGGDSGSSCKIRTSSRGSINDRLIDGCQKLITEVAGAVHFLNQPKVNHVFLRIGGP